VKIPVRNADGKEVKALEVDDSVFGIQPNMAVLHQAFVAQRANQRWGTAQTKSRGEVQGSTRKVRMQKYTGRARQGSNRAPHRVGGGVAFGPRRRDYSQALPKKMRRLAIRSALSGKVADGQLVVIDRISFDRPQTKEMMRVLRSVGIERSALIVTAQTDPVVKASARNLAKTKVLPAAYLNVVDLMNHSSTLMTEEAVRVAEGLWGHKDRAAAPAIEPAPRTGRLATRRAARAAAPQPEPQPAAEPAAPAPRRARKAAPEAEAPAPKRTGKAVRAQPAPAAEAAAPVTEKPARATRARPPRAPEAEAAAPVEEKPRRPARARVPKAPPAAEEKPRRPARARAPKAPPAAEEKPRRRARKTEGKA